MRSRPGRPVVAFWAASSARARDDPVGLAGAEGQQQAARLEVGAANPVDVAQTDRSPTSRRRSG